MVGIPSADELIKLAKQRKSNATINDLHEETYKLMLEFRDKYYEQRVDEFLSGLDFSGSEERIKQQIKMKLLEPITVTAKKKSVTYSNFMEEVSRRISQTFQPVSGNLAELCLVEEVKKVGLKEDIHYMGKKAKRVRTDFIFIHITQDGKQLIHRVEVKNVSLRERAARGLVFDGDSLAGFFNQPDEFTAENIKVIDESCQKTGGYCYIPPATLAQITHNTQRFRPNTQFAADMVYFVKTGTLP